MTQTFKKALLFGLLYRRKIFMCEYTEKIYQKPLVSNMKLNNASFIRNVGISIKKSV